MESSNRLLSLDALRGIAVLLVLGRHMPLGSEALNPLWKPVFLWQQGGWIGVDLFFVLSGFLVSGLLFREYRRTRQLSVGRFLIRRGFKIYPAFYFFLGCTLFFVIWARRGNVPWAEILCEACFVQNYGPGLWDHTWSLAVEEHFYLLLPLVLILLTARRKGATDPFQPVLITFAVVAAVSLLLRWHQARLIPFSYMTHILATHLRLDGLWFGVAIAYLYHFQRETLLVSIRGRERLMMLVAVVLMVPPFVLYLEESFFLPTLGLSCLYVAGGLLICVWLSRPLPPNLIVRFIAWIGYYSYSIYLWHFFVQRAVFAKWSNSGSLEQPPWSVYLLYVLASVLTGVFMAKVIEYPFLALRDRLVPTRAPLVEPQHPDSLPTLSTAP